MTNMTISLGRTAKASIGKFVDVLQHMQGFEVKPNRARPKWRTRVLIFYTKHRLFSALRHVLSLMVSPFASVNKGACIEANPSTHVGFPIVDVGRMDNLLSCTNGAPWTSKRSVAHPNSSAVDADSQEASMPISSENLVPQKWRPLQFDPISGIKFQAQAHSESQPLCIHEVSPKCASGQPQKSQISWLWHDLTNQKLRILAINNPTINPLDTLNWNGDPMWSTWFLQRKAWPQQCCLSSSQHASEDGHWNASLGRLKRWKLSKLKHHWACISVWSLTATKPKKHSANSELPLWHTPDLSASKLFI